MKYLIGWWNKDKEWVEKELDIKDGKIALSVKEFESAISDIYIVRKITDEQSQTPITKSK